MAEPAPDKKDPVRGPAKWAKDLADSLPNPKDSKVLAAQCREAITKAVDEDKARESWKVTILAGVYGANTLEKVLREIEDEMTGSGLTIHIKPDTSGPSSGQVDRYQVTIFKIRTFEEAPDDDQQPDDDDK